MRLVWVGLLATTLLTGCGAGSEQANLPDDLVVGKVIYGAIDRNLAFEEGVVVYELPASFAEQIRKKGTGGFQPSKEGPSAGRSGYGPWQETPALRSMGDYVDIHSGRPVRALNVLNCGRVQSGTWSDKYSLCSALTSPGNYYSLRGDREIVLVVPDRKLAAYAISDQ